MIRRGQASCREVGRRLQAFLDHEVDHRTQERIESHLDDCRRCGLEADAYRAIKASISSRTPELDPAAMQRLRSFGEHLAGRGEP